MHLIESRQLPRFSTRRGLVASRHFIGAHVSDEGGSVALYVLFPSGSVDGEASVVSFVRAFRTNSAGQVVLSVLFAEYDGFQTEDGFYVSGTIPVSATSGLYSVACQTVAKYRGRDVLGVYDWSGEAAIVTKQDSVYVHLNMRNAKGGTTGIAGVAPIRGGDFELKSPDGKQALSGHLGAGRLDARWVSVLDWDLGLSGDLIGQRE